MGGLDFPTASGRVAGSDLTITGSNGKTFMHDNLKAVDCKVDSEEGVYEGV